MNNPYMIYCFALAASGVFSLLTAFWFFRLNDKNLESREKMPRNTVFGAIITIIAIIWCIPQAKPVVPPGFQHLIMPAAVISGVLAIAFLDYLFSRALGGLLILLAHYLLHDSFTFHTPLSPLFALFCFVIGTVGIFFAGKPYLMRDLIRKSAKEKKLRFAVSGFFTFFAAFCIGASVLHFCGAH